MTSVILHAGMHKTGSSFLQNTLHANRDVLSDAGILYPSTGLHLDSPQAGYRHLGLRRSLAQEGPECFAMARLREEVASSDCHTFVISYEGFFTPDTKPADLRQAFDGYDVTVLLFLRHPVDYIESKYREWVRLLNDSSEIEQFLSWQWPFLDVLTRAEEWEHHFGREHIAVRSYDQLRSPSDILEQLLGLTSAPEVVLQPASSSNPSASNEFTLAKLLANRLRLSGTPIGVQLVESMAVDYGGNGGRLLSGDAADQIERRSAPGFAALLERYGQNPLLQSRWATMPQDTAFFDHSVRESILGQLHDAHEQKLAEKERRTRAKAEADASARNLRNELKQSLDRANGRSRVLEERLQHTSTCLEGTESRLRIVESRLKTVEARLQACTAERSDLRYRLKLLKIWRISNWPEYLSIVGRGLWRSASRRESHERSGRSPAHGRAST